MFGLFHSTAPSFATRIGIPIGAALSAFGFFGLRYMKDDAISAQDRMTNDGQFGKLTV